MGRFAKYGGRAVAFIRDYIIPPTCPGCRARLPIENPYAPFCAECRGQWEKEKLAPCSVCGLSMLDCGCLPKLLTAEGVRDALFLTEYRPGGATLPDRLLYYIKEERDRRVFDFLGRELFYRIRLFMRTEGISPADMIVTALPRRRAAVREHGFDQAVVLAKSLAKELHVPYRCLISRKREQKEQKTLTAEERRENLRNAFRSVGNTELDGKYVFLVDDVMTTGSGLLVGTELLSAHGAARVIPTVIARTALRKGKRKAEHELCGKGVRL